MHYKERLIDRILKKRKINVGFEMDNFNYEIIGSVFLSKKQKIEINNKIKNIKLNELDSKFSFAIKIFEWDLKDFLIKKPINAKGPVPVIVDKTTESNGTTLYAIIRKNKITTVMMVKPYGLSVKDKCNVDFVK